MRIGPGCFSSPRYAIGVGFDLVRCSTSITITNHSDARHSLASLFGTYVLNGYSCFFYLWNFQNQDTYTTRTLHVTDRTQRQTQIDKPVQATPAVCLFLVRLSLGRGDRISQVAQAAGHGVAPPAHIVAGPRGFFLPSESSARHKGPQDQVWACQSYC